jgi:hypothetical protein
MAADSQFRLSRNRDARGQSAPPQCVNRGRYGSIYMEEIEEFWLREKHRHMDSWIEHADINDVILATNLDPGSTSNCSGPYTDRRGAAGRQQAHNQLGNQCHGQPGIAHHGQLPEFWQP